MSTDWNIVLALNVLRAYTGALYHFELTEICE